MPAQLPAVMVTGANGGIGTALTRALVDAGYTVYAGVRDVDQARATLAPEARLVRLDVTDPAGVEATAADVARQQQGAGLHALVNNAGIIVQGPGEGGAATLRLVTSPQLDHVTGRFFDGTRDARAHEQAYDPDARAELRRRSDELVEAALAP